MTDLRLTQEGIQIQVQLARPGFVLDVDLQLPPKGLTALLGPSGSGKTTCLRVLAGLEPQARGVVRVQGEVWLNSAQQVFRPVHQRAIGYVFQEASLFEHLNVKDNLQYGFKRTPVAERRHNWDLGLELLGIGHLLARRPHELSGGERQRVAMARALAASPRVLLMDEPLASLDGARKADILPWLEQLHERLDIPVLYVTHSVDEVAQLADEVVLLDRGRVQARGTVMDMLTRTDLPLAHGDSASALVAARVRGAVSSEGISVLDFDGGQLLLPQTHAVALPAQKPVRLRIQARDVSLALDRPQRSSVLNILSATVVDVVNDGPAQVLVGLRLGDAGCSTRLLSRISLLSARTLSIAPGVQVFAQIKGVALVR